MDSVGFAAKWAQRQHAFPAAMGEAVREHTAAVFEASKSHLQKDIYGKPPDLTQSSYKKVKTVSLAGAGNAMYKGRTFAQWANARGPIAALRAGKLVHGVNKKTGQRTVSLHVLHSATESEAANARKRGMQDWREAGSGKAKWRQTGDLGRAEAWSVQGAAHQTVGRIINTMGYARPRHDLGLPAGSARAYEGSRRQSTRIAPWRKDAIADVAPRALEMYRKAVQNALNR